MANENRKPSIVIKLATGHESDFDDVFHPRKTIKRFIEQEPAGLWTRKILEDLDNNWLLAIARRHPDVREKHSGCCLILCGGGYDLLLLLSDATIPEDISTIPRVTVSTCVATKRAAGEFIENEPVDEYGALCPTDSLHEQVLAELQPIADCRIYLDSTASDTFGSISGGNVEDKRVVKCLVTDSWLLIRSEVEDIGEHAHVFQTDNAEDPVPTAKSKHPVPGTGSKLGFNPKEFLLLEKAFHGELKTNDLKHNGSYTKSDIKQAMKLARKLDKVMEEEPSDDATDKMKANENDGSTVAKSQKAESVKTKSSNDQQEKSGEHAGTKKKRDTDDQNATSGTNKKTKTDGYGEEQPTKRGRGRPKGSKNKKTDPKDSKKKDVKGDELASTDSTVTEQTKNTPKKPEADKEGAPAKRGRGRPKGSKNKPKESNADTPKVAKVASKSTEKESVSIPPGKSKEGNNGDTNPKAKSSDTTSIIKKAKTSGGDEVKSKKKSKKRAKDKEGPDGSRMHHHKKSKALDGEKDGDDTPKKKRGRPKGSKNKKETEKIEFADL